ncbi:MAG TPA: pantoate--beta-alanine ligase, partial [Pelobium sp.]|nr:pantoate--beta-alanine ligase [Pelobium sp.]
MRTFDTKNKLVHYLNSVKGINVKIGLVPTMGALHQGHLSLIAASKKACDITIATIFVNPTQFNNADDLLKYPKPIEKDQNLLKAAGCDVLFNPEAGDVYEAGEHWDYEVGKLNTVLEGAFRPGHYQGVTQIVYKLLTLVKPDCAYFGQ